MEKKKRKTKLSGTKFLYRMCEEGIWDASWRVEIDHEINAGRSS